MLTQIYALIILIVLSAFFSMSETALISLSRIKLRTLLKKNIKGAETVRKLKDNPHRLLSTILIGNNVVNITAASLATSIAFKIIPHYAVAVSTGITTFIILVFGEIIPKSFATHQSEKISLFVANPIMVLSNLLNPLIWILDKITGIFLKPVNIPLMTEEEMKACFELGEKAGIVKDIERDLLKNVFKFDEINVSEIMTPRTDMFCVEVNNSLKKVLPSIIKANYTRIPVYENNLNNIVGILNIKDLIPIVKKGNLNILIKKLMYNPFFVPETKRLDSLLNQFRKRKEHMAIVVDEHGLVTGLVTLENVIEEIVGEIKDETDKVDPHIRKVGKNTWDVLGKSDIEEVNEKIRSSFKEAEDYDTISGMILNRLGRIPKEKDTVDFGEYSIEVADVEGNRIIEVKIRKK